MQLYERIKYSSAIKIYIDFMRKMSKRVRMISKNITSFRISFIALFFLAISNVLMASDYQNAKQPIEVEIRKLQAALEQCSGGYYRYPPANTQDWSYGDIDAPGFDKQGLIDTITGLVGNLNGQQRFCKAGIEGSDDPQYVSSTDSNSLIAQLTPASSGSAFVSVTRNLAKLYVRYRISVTPLASYTYASSAVSVEDQDGMPHSSDFARSTAISKWGSGENSFQYDGLRKIWVNCSLQPSSGWYGNVTYYGRATVSRLFPDVYGQCSTGATVEGRYGSLTFDLNQWKGSLNGTLYFKTMGDAGVTPPSKCIVDGKWHAFEFGLSGGAPYVTGSINVEPNLVSQVPEHDLTGGSNVRMWNIADTLIVFDVVFCLQPPCPDLCACNYTSPGKGGTTSMPAVKTKQLSTADNTNLTFIHMAIDYQLTASGGCAPCGTAVGSDAGVPRLQVQRILAPSSGLSGSFGWGGFLATDLRVRVDANQVALFFPHSGYEARFDRDASGVPIIGDAHLARAIRSYSATNTLVPLDSAVRIEIDGYDDRTLVFELSPILNGVRLGRLLRQVDAVGTTTSLTYRWVATDLATDPTGGGKWWGVKTVTGPGGDIATITTSSTPIGDAYPITSILLPDGKTLAYTYGVWATVGGTTLTGLTQVTHPVGALTTIAGGARADGDLDLTIVDPAETDAAHQAKTVTLSGPTWIDPLTGGAAPWLVRAVRNAAGEYAYRNRRLFSADGSELWTVVEDHGTVLCLVMTNRGTPLRTDRATGQVDWATDPATWTWQTLATYSISSGARLVGTRDAIGRTQSWSVSTVTGLSEGATDASGLSSITVRDALGRIMQETDRLGRVTQYIRDASGNPLSITRAFGTAQASTENWTYNAQGLPLTKTDARGFVTDYAYNAAGQLLTETQPADVAGGTRGVTTRTYDTVGRLTKIIDPAGRITQFAYDARNRLVATTYGDTTTETVTYGTGADAGRVVAKKDRNGKTTTYGYDAAGRRNLTSITVTRADGTTETLTETCTFVPGTELEKSCTRNGETTVYGYDALGRRTAATVYATLTSALTTTWAYDAVDRRISETDPYGRRTLYVYDQLDRVVRTVRESVPGAVPANADLTSLVRQPGANPSYAIEDVAYDAEGQIVSRFDAHSMATVYAYDSQGRMFRQIVGLGTPAEATTTFTYDAAGNQTRIDHPRTLTEGAVFATVKTYTNRNLVKTVEEASGRSEAGTTAYTYGLDRRVATVTDGNAKVTTNTYSTCCGRLTQVQDPLGFLIKYTYDGNGNVLTTVDGNNLTTTMTYDARNRPLKRTDALGKVWTYAYDDNLLDGAGLDATAKYATQLAGLGFGRDATTGYGADGSAVALLDPNGNETVTVYDGAGRVVRTINALKKTTTTTYDQPVTDAVSGAALIATVRTDALGATTAQWSDGLGRVRVQVDALGKQMRSTYDAAGNRLSVLDADGVGETCTYDVLGRKATCSNAGNGAVTYQYDAAGNLVRTTDAQGGAEIAAFDARNRKVYQEDRVGAQTRFTFDAVGNLLTITDGQNGVTTYSYDARNLLLTETFPGTTGGTRAYTYDAGRRLQTRKDQTNLVTTYVYDNANHLTARQYPDSLNDTFTYDAGGRLLTAVSGRYGTTVTRTYDKANRVLTEKLALGSETWTNTGVYNDTGLLTKLTLPDGTAQDRGYTTRNELNSVKLASTTVATRTYTDGGRLATTVSANGKTETRTYTAAGDGLVEKITIPSVTDFTYTYDSLKRKTAEIDLITPSNTQNFSYDAANRLVGWNRVTGTAGPIETQQTWNLSLVGDWTSTTKDGVVENRTHTPVHEVSTVGAATLLYDAKGNLTKDQQAQTFTWDVENRLASAAALVQQSGQTSATYLYDALGRRVRKTVGQNETTWVSWGAQEVYELARNPTAIAADQPPTTPTGGGAVPVTGGSTYPSGSLLADANATHITFQPAAATTPVGWLADTGAVYGVRSGATSFGWVGAALNQTVDRAWTGWSLYDTFNQPWTTWATAGSTRATWELGVANGTYPVVMVCGDAHGIQQRNDFLVEGVAFTDPSPWNGSTANPTTGQLGKFVYLSGTVTVADGKLTIQPNTTAKAPKICFIEVGAVGTVLDANFVARATAALSTVNARTANGRPDAVKPVITLSMFGSYVDDLLGYRVQKSVGAYAVKTSYWTHSNHLYSVAAVTSSTGAVVERYSYNAYGLQTVKNAGGTVIAATAIGQLRGFTGYRRDGEMGFYCARERIYSGGLGRFISRDSMGYINGLSLYSGYFAPNSVDPLGLYDYAGHFATTYLVAIAAGYAPERAYQFALWSQIPDQIDGLNAMYAGGGGMVGGWIGQKFWLNKTRDDVQAFLHSLTDGRADDQRKFLNCLLKSGKFSPSEVGLLIHSFGDSYAHSYTGTHPGDAPFGSKGGASYKMSSADNFDTLYTNGIGHLFQGHSPDHISSDPTKFNAYVAQLFQTLVALNPGAKTNPGLITQLASAATGFSANGLSDEAITAMEYAKINELSGYGDVNDPSNRGYNVGNYDPSAGENALPKIFDPHAGIETGIDLINKMKRAKSDGICCGD